MPPRSSKAHNLSQSALSSSQKRTRVNPPEMILFNAKIWGTTAAVVVAASAAAGVVWFVRRRRPTPDEVEQLRRQRLVESGRLVDGMLLDIRELPDEEGRARTFFFYSYSIGGVEYECSQDVTTIRDAAQPALVRAGFPCSVRYLPGSPENSIVVSEAWSGLRTDPPYFAPAPNLNKPGSLSAP